MDQRDLALWLTQMLMRGRVGEAYNVGSEDAVSILDLAHLVRDIVAPQKPVHRPERPAPEDAERNRYVPSTEKASRELGLSLRWPLDRAIAYAAEAI